MNNICVCRSFTFFRDRIANRGTENLSKEYVSIGYYDAFETQLIDTKDSEKSFSEFYTKNCELEQKVSKFQTFNNIFGLRNEKDNEKKDEKFWSTEFDNTYPLTFVSLFQFEKNINNMDTKVEKLLQNTVKTLKIDVKFIIYYTLDKNDCIICFRAHNYIHVVNCLNDFYKKLNNGIIYSYTNFIVKQNFIDGSMDCLEHINEKINSICIKAVFKNKCNLSYEIKDIVNEFTNLLSKHFYGNESEQKLNSKEIVGYEILGDTDCRFIARDIDLRKVLKLFSEEGLLNIKNEKFNKYFTSSMTSLNIMPEESDSKEDLNLAQENSEEDELNVLFCLLINEYKDSHPTLVVLMSKIYKYIEYFKNQSNQFYEYFLLKEPIEVLLNTIKNNSDKIKNGELFLDEIYKALDAICSTVQGNMRLDTKMFHVTDFSTMAYYAPTKLRTLYSNVVNKISTYYSLMDRNNSKYKYKFFIIPANCVNTNVEQIWSDIIDEDKVMIVYITEKDLYNINYLSFQLAHEVAHFAGGENVRKRFIRFDFFMEFMYNTIYEQISNLFLSSIDNSSIKDVFKKCKPSFYQFFQETKSVWINKKEKIINELYDKGKIEKKEHFYYKNNMKKYYSFIFAEPLLNTSLDIYLNLIRIKLKEGSYTKNKAIEYSDLFYKIIEIIKNDLKIKIRKDGMGFAENILILMTECYADLSAVLLFDLNIGKYFNIIFERLKGQEDCFYSQLFMRACIVTSVLKDIYIDDQEIFNNSFFQFSDCFLDDQLKIKNIKNMCETIQNGKLKIAYYTYKYLRFCAYSQIEAIKSDESLIKLRNEIKSIYIDISSMDIVRLITKINQLNDSIREDFNKNSQT